MIDNAFDFDITIPLIIHMRNIASSVGVCEIYNFFDKKFQITTYLRQHAGKVIYCTFVRIHLAISLQFLVVRSRLWKPLNDSIVEISCCLLTQREHFW